MVKAPRDRFISTVAYARCPGKSADQPSRFNGFPLPTALLFASANWPSALDERRLQIVLAAKIIK
jgi:hypothetical protein